MSAKTPEAAEAIESRLPDESPEMRKRRGVRVSISPEAFDDWSRAEKEQLEGVLYALGTSLEKLAGLSPEVREDALRQVGFQVGPVMTETIMLAERLPVDAGEKPAPA